MSIVKPTLAVIHATLNKGRILHYLDIFVAASVVDLADNQQHILGAHGLNAWKSLVAGAAIAGVKALIETYRKSGRPNVIASLLATVAGKAAK